MERSLSHLLIRFRFTFCAHVTITTLLASVLVGFTYIEQVGPTLIFITPFVLKVATACNSFDLEVTLANCILVVDG